MSGLGRTGMLYKTETTYQSGIHISVIIGITHSWWRGARKSPELRQCILCCIALHIADNGCAFVSLCWIFTITHGNNNNCEMVNAFIVGSIHVMSETITWHMVHRARWISCCRRNTIEGEYTLYNNPVIFAAKIKSKTPFIYALLKAHAL